MATGTIKRTLANAMDCGSVSATVTPGAVATTHVDFHFTFPAVPQVVACLGENFSSTGQAAMSLMQVSASTITTSGFDIKVGYNPAGSSSLSSITVRWIAMAR